MLPDDAGRSDELDSDDESFEKEELDSDDGTADEPVPPCPHCGSKESCDHQVLYWSEGNWDWDGKLADKTSHLQDELIHALWSAIKTKGQKTIKSGEWSRPLSGLIGGATDFGFDPGDHENCDWGRPIREYWIELSDAAGGCCVRRWSFDFGNPMQGLDSFGLVFAEDPTAAIAAIAEACKRDIESLRRFAESSGTATQPGSAEPV